MFSGFYLIFYIILTSIIFKLIMTYIKNENSPIIATKAQLIKKKRDIHTQTGDNGVMATNETLILIFQLDTGSELKFIVGDRIYRSISEYEWGTLTFQGTRFLKFKWKNELVEK